MVSQNTVSEVSQVRVRSFSVPFGHFYASEFSVASHIQTIAVGLSTDAQTKAITRLEQLGIIKSGVTDLRSIQKENIRGTITEKRLQAALRDLSVGSADSIQLIADSPAPGLISRTVSDATDAVWGIYQSHIESREDSDIENDPAITAGASLGKNTAMGLAIAFATCAVTACSAQAITSGLSIGTAAAITTASLPIVPIAIGVAGAAILIGYAKSPTFRDAVNRSFFPIATVAVGMLARHHFADSGYLVQLGVYLGSMIGIQGVRAMASKYLVEKPRAHTLLKDPETREHTGRRNVAFRVLNKLDRVRMGKESVDGIINWLEKIGLNKKYERAERIAALKLRRMLDNNKHQDLDALSSLVNEYMAKHIRVIKDIREPNQKLLVTTRLSRIFNLLYLGNLTLCWASGGFSTVNALIFGVLYLSQVYYSIGTAWTDKITEMSQYVENTGLPELPMDPEHRPTIMATRYSNKGTLSRDNPLPPFMQADIYNRVYYGNNYYVTFNNDSNNHFWFEATGPYKLARRIEARMHYLVEEVFPKIPDMPTDKRELVKIAFSLSIKEFEVDPMRMVDHATNYVYPEGCADGATIRFRDGHSSLQRGRGQSIGDSGGELTCFRALANIAAGADPKVFSYWTRRKIRKALWQIIGKEAQMDLASIHETEKIDSLCERLQKMAKLTDVQRDALRDEIIEKKDSYLIATLRTTAERAGIDEFRALAIAHGIVERTKNYQNINAIAETADKLMLGLDVSGNEEDELKNKLIEEYKVSAAAVDSLVSELKTGKIEAGAKVIDGSTDVPAPLFFRAFRYAQLVMAWERTGTKSEEGNISYLWRTLRDEDPTTMSDERKEMRDFLATCAGQDPAKPEYDPKKVTEWVDSIRQLGSEKYNVATPMLIARAMQFAMQGRDMGSQKKTLKLSRLIAYEVAKRAAKIQPVSSGYEKKYNKLVDAGRTASVDVVDRLVWEEFTGNLNHIIEDTVDELIKEKKLPKKMREEIIEITKEAAIAEFNGNKNEVFRTALGLVEIASHELVGVREIDRRLQADAKFQDNLRARLMPVIQDRADARGAASALSDDDFKKLRGAVSSLVAAGVGSVPGKKGYLLTFEEITEQVIGMLAHKKKMTITSGDEVYELAGWKDHKEVVARLREEVKDKKEIERILKLLVEAEIEEKRVKAQTEEWVRSQTGEYSEKWGYARVVEEATSVPLAGEIVSQMLGKNSVSLEDKEVEIVQKLINEQTKEYGLPKIAKAAEPLEKERKEILTKLLEGIDLKKTEKDSVKRPEDQAAADPDAAKLIPSFDSVYRFSRVWGWRWGKGKAENTNREMLGSTVNEQIGVLTRWIADIHFAERRGFYYGSTLLTQKLKVEVVQPLQLSTDETKNWERKLELGLRPQDLMRRIMHEVAENKLSGREAARKVWKEIEGGLTRDERKIVEAWSHNSGLKKIPNAVISASKKPIRLNYVLDQIRNNLYDIANEVAVEFHTAKALEIYFETIASTGKPDRKEAKAYVKASVPFFLRRKVWSMVVVEKARLAKNAAHVDEYKRAIKDGDYSRALEVEQLIEYKGDPSTWTAQYRHGNPHPELIVGNKARSFSELAAWISSSQHAAERSIENGEWADDSIMLRNIADVADTLMSNIKDGKREEILNGLSQEAKPIVDALIADKDNMDYDRSKARLFKDLGKDEAKALQERKELFLKLLSIILEDKEKNPVAGEKKIVNCLDEKKYPKTAIEQVRATVQMNADTDNYFFPELLDSASYLGCLYGILTNPNEVLQYGLNYKVKGRSPFMRFQRDRDLGGPQNNNSPRSAGAALGVVRHRFDRREGTNTLTGYANLVPMTVAHRVAEYVIEPNIARTSYHGQKALEKIFGKDWWSVDGGNTKWAEMSFWDFLPGIHDSREGKWSLGYRWRRRIANYWYMGDKDGITSLAFWKPGTQQKRISLFVNNLARRVGKENGWDLAMSLSRTPLILTILSGSAWTMGKAVNLGVGFVLGTDLHFDVAESLGFSLGNVFAYSLGVTAIIKGLGYLAGRTLNMYNFYRGRWVYVLDPSEDLATTMPMAAKSISLTSLQGLRQQNDAMIEYDGDMFQKLRWMASNAANLGRALHYCFKYRKIMPPKMAFDLIQGPLYNIFGVPAIANRLAILGFVAVGEPSILMLDNEATPLPLQNNLDWLIETGFINYAMVEMVLRGSRIWGGSSWKGVTTNMGYQTVMEMFNYNFVMRRWWHGEKSTFNTTDPPEQPLKVKMWGRHYFTEVFGAQSTALHMLGAFALYRLISRHIWDSANHSDFMEMHMASLVFWIALPLMYYLTGMRLNQGISSVRDEATWEKKNKVWDGEVK